MIPQEVFDSINDNIIQDDDFSQSDENISDWTNLVPQQPRQVSDFYYFRYQSDIRRIEDSLDSVGRRVAEDAFQYILDYYNKKYDEQDPQQLANLYIGALGGDSRCFYGFEFRENSNFEVFLKLPNALIESFNDVEKQKPDPQADLIEIDDYNGFKDTLSFLQKEYIKNNKFLEQNGYEVVIDTFTVDLEKEAEFVRKFSDNLDLFLVQNSFDSDSIDIGVDQKQVKFVLDSDGERLSIGENDIENSLPFYSDINYFTVKNYKEINQAFSDPSILFSEKILQSFPGSSLRKREIKTNNRKDNLLDGIKIGGVNVLETLDSANNIYKKAKQFGRQEKRDMLFRKGQDILEEQALSKQDEVLKKIDDKFAEEEIFVGNEFLDIKNIDNLNSVSSVDEIYNRVLNKIGSKQLFELIIDCIGGDILSETVDLIFEGPPQFDPLALPIPDNLPTVDILGFLSNAVKKILLTILSKIISTLLSNIFRELRNCLKQEVKDTVPANSNNIQSNSEENVTNSENINSDSISTDESIKQSAEDRGFTEERFGSFMDDLTVSLSFQELCDLLRGNADDETYKIVEKILDAKYPSIREELNNRSKIDAIFQEFGSESLERLNRFCRNKFGVEPSKIGEHVCPEEGVRENIRKELLGNKNLEPSEIEDLIECEKERDRKKAEFFKNMAESDSPLADMIYGDKEPEQFIKENTPSAGENDAVMKVVGKQARDNIEIIEDNFNSNQGIIEDNIKKVQKASGFTGDKLGKNFNVNISPDEISLSSNAKSVSLSKFQGEYFLFEDNNKLRKVRIENDDKIENVEKAFVDLTENSLFKNEFDNNGKNYIKNQIFPIFISQINESFRRRLVNIFNKQDKNRTIRFYGKYFNSNFIKQSAPDAKSNEQFTLQNFKEREKKSRDTRKESLRSLKESLILLWLKLKIMEFYLVTAPLDDLSIIEVEDDLIKSELVEDILNSNNNYKKILEELGYSDPDEIYQDFENQLKSENIIKGNPELERLFFGEKNFVDLGNIDPDAQGFFLERFIVLTQRDEENILGVQEFFDSDLSDLNPEFFDKIEYGLRLSFNDDGLPNPTFYASGELSRYPFEFIGAFGEDFMDDETTYKFGSVPISMSKIDVTSDFNKDGIKDFDNYSRALSEEVYDQVLSSLPYTVSTSLLRMYIFEILKRRVDDVFDGIFNISDQIIPDLVSNFESLEEGDNLFQY